MCTDTKLRQIAENTCTCTVHSLIVPADAAHCHHISSHPFRGSPAQSFYALDRVCTCILSVLHICAAKALYCAVQCFHAAVLAYVHVCMYFALWPINSSDRFLKSPVFHKTPLSFFHPLESHFVHCAFIAFFYTVLCVFSLASLRHCDVSIARAAGLVLNRSLLRAAPKPSLQSPLSAPPFP